VRVLVRLVAPPRVARAVSVEGGPSNDVALRTGGAGMTVERSGSGITSASVATCARTTRWSGGECSWPGAILLTTAPEVVRPSYRDTDFTADECCHLLSLGIGAYSSSGVIGRPSLATAEKGRLLLESLSTLFKSHLALLRS
jgi:hypothetical protein